MKNDPVIGATITNVRQMTKEEIEAEGWQFSTPEDTIVLVLSTGAIIYPSADYEGNGPGVLFGMESNQGFALNIVKK